MAAQQSQGTGLHGLLNLSPYYRGLRTRAVGGFLTALGEGVAMLPVPIIIQGIIDERFPQADTVGIVWDAAAVVGLCVVCLILRVLSAHWGLGVAKALVHRLRSAAVQKLNRLSIGYYDRENLGRLHARVIQDTEKVDIFADYLGRRLPVQVCVALGSFAVMVALHPPLAMLVAVAVVLCSFTLRIFGRRIAANYREWREHFDTFSSSVQEYLRAIRLIRAYTAGPREMAELTDRVELLSERGRACWTFIAFFEGVIAALFGVATVVVVLGGGFFVVHGSLTAGGFVAFYALQGRLFGTVQGVLGSTEQYFSGRVALDSLFALLDEPDTEPERVEGLERSIEGEVRFEEVRFGYDPGHPVLRGVSFVARPGQTTAIVGNSGAGKTTLFRLLLGFYEPQGGRILIDGRDMLEHTTRSLRSQLAVVSQESLIRAGTVEENIRYGRPDASDEAFAAAARLACVDTFIDELPDGYDTKVEEQGTTLSGGQRQRIAIARAILRDPRILILDEPTSALDAHSERMVQRAIENLRRDRTVLIIAHRFSTIRDADRIVVMHDGAVVEEGVHTELLARSGAYADLHTAQYGLPARLSSIPQEGRRRLVREALITEVNSVLHFDGADRALSGADCDGPSAEARCPGGAWARQDMTLSQLGVRGATAERFRTSLTRLAGLEVPRAMLAADPTIRQLAVGLTELLVTGCANLGARPMRTSLFDTTLPARAACGGRHD